MYSVSPGKLLVLGSASPRRVELLRSAGLEFTVDPPQVDENLLAGESAQECVARLSRRKAEQVSSRHPNTWILAADTVVLIDGEILGKPLDRSDAARMLSKIQGRTHQVWGGFTVLHAKGEVCTETHCSLVEIVPLSAGEIEAYISGGEPMDKAGSYAVQGVGSSFIRSVQGSYSNVVGLALAQTLATLKRLGVVSTEKRAG